ncbi:MAG: AMP-binding protein, partial [Myxococcota bacterium]|nr:AMP-binding protein [Myxococcota bacterium]
MLDPTSYSSLGELLGDALIQFKSDTALVEMNRKRETGRTTYLALRHTGNQVAQRLEDLGVSRDDRVAILMSNQPKWLLSAYGALYRGAVLVPLDYKLQAAEQAALMAHCKPKVLITEYPIWRKLDALDDRLAADHVWVTDAPQDADLGEAARWEDLPETAAPTAVPRQREDIATIVYSSGTGGEAKGCMLSHRAYLAQARILMDLYPMQRGERYFSILPTNHAIDFMCGFIVPLCSGAMVIHQRTLRPEFILDTMRRMQVTHMALVPLVLNAFERAIRQKLEALPKAKRQMVEALASVNQSLTVKRPNPAVSRLLLKPIHDAFGGKLQFLFCGGAFVDRKRAEFFYRLGIPVVIGYGLTEACTVATVNDLKPFRADSVGRTVPGMEIVIDQPNAHGVGQVLIKGDTLMSGYLDAPELTDETLVDGWLHTGDLGHIDASGHLHLVGRSRNMIVTEGGKN